MENPRATDHEAMGNILETTVSEGLQIRITRDRKRRLHLVVGIVGHASIRSQSISLWDMSVSEIVQTLDQLVRKSVEEIESKGWREKGEGDRGAVSAIEQDSATPEEDVLPV